MINSEKERLKLLREKGYSYSKISKILSISENTIKSFCRRNKLNIVREKIVSEKCKQCGNDYENNHKGPNKKFCSDRCRREWWKDHDYCICKKAYYKLICCECGQEFQSYGNKDRKYCSHDCYIKNRFGKGDRGDE